MAQAPVRPAASAPSIPSERIEGAPPAAEEDPSKPRTANSQGGGCPGPTRRAYARARIGGAADDSGPGDESEGGEHEELGAWPCEDLRNHGDLLVRVRAAPDPFRAV